MAKGIYFDGRRIIRPQAVTKIDDSGMYARGLGGGNTLALVGECSGGEPGKVMYYTDPSYAKAILRSGALLQAIQRAYDPSDSVPGAYLVAAIRVNPAIQATLNLKDAFGNPLIKLTSYDYGVWNNLIRARVQSGSNSLGKKLTFTYGLSFDQGDQIYRKSFAMGLSDPLVTGTPTVTIDTVGNALTTTVNALPQKVYYPDGSTLIDPAHYPLSLPFNPISEYLYIGSDIEFDSALFTVSTPNATGSITPTAKFWNGIHWADLSANFSGIGGATPFSTTGSVSFAKPATWTKGATDGPSDSLYWIRIEMSAPLDALTAVSAITVGRGLRIALTDYPTIQQLVDYIDSQAGYQAHVLTTNPSGELSTQLDDVSGSLVPFSTFLTSSYDPSVTDNRVLTLNLSSEFHVGDYVIVASLDGLKYDIRRVTVLGPATNQITIDSALSVAYTSGDTNNVVRKALALDSDLQAVIDWINAGNTSLVSAVYHPSAINRAALANMPDTYLTGGSDGTTTQADWDAALALLQTEDVPLISCVSFDPAVWASLSAHCSYMSSVGKKERIGFCGGFDNSYNPNSGGLGLWNNFFAAQESIAKMLEYANDLNSDRMVYVGPGFKAYDENGTLISFPGSISAALVAGMAAGVDVATALTHQYIKVLGLEYNFQWADLDRLLEGGICPFEYDPGTGYRVCQSITSWLINDKYNRRELSVRRTADYVARQVRDRLEQDFVGKKGTMTTLISIKNATESVLAQMYRAELLAGNAENPPYKNIQCRLEGDTCYVDFECSPVIPINYIPITIHLTVFTTTLTA